MSTDTERIDISNSDGLTIKRVVHAGRDQGIPGIYNALYAFDESIEDLSFQMFRSNEQDPPYYLLDWYTDLKPDAVRQELIDFGAIQPPTVYAYSESNADNLVEPDTLYDELDESTFAATSLDHVRNIRVWRKNGESQSLLWRKSKTELGEYFDSKFVAFMDTSPLGLLDMIKRTRSLPSLDDLQQRLEILATLYTTNIDQIHS